MKEERVNFIVWAVTVMMYLSILLGIYMLFFILCAIATGIVYLVTDADVFRLDWISLLALGLTVITYIRGKLMGRKKLNHEN